MTIGERATENKTRSETERQRMLKKIPNSLNKPRKILSNNHTVAGPIKLFLVSINIYLLSLNELSFYLTILIIYESTTLITPRPLDNIAVLLNLLSTKTRVLILLVIPYYQSSNS